MKQRDLIRHLLTHGCILIREGSKHSIYASGKTGATVAVPRHREIKKFVAESICEVLGIPLPWSFRSDRSEHDCSVMQRRRGRRREPIRSPCPLRLCVRLKTA